MASLRRAAGNGDGPTARFLYAVLRQLDTRSIDWNEVAEVVECTNGHAARMRYSRFRAHMEGTNGTTRRSEEPQERRKTKTTRRKKGKAKKVADAAIVKTDPVAGEQIGASEGAAAQNAEVDQQQQVQQTSNQPDQKPEYRDQSYDGPNVAAQAYYEQHHDADDEASAYIKKEGDMDCTGDTSVDEQYIEPELMDDLEVTGSAFTEEMANLSVDYELDAMRVDFLDACRYADFGLNEYFF